MLKELINNLFGRGARRQVETRTASPPTMERLEDRLLLTLIGVQPLLETPLVPYDSTGTVSYDADPASANFQEFTADALPIALVTDSGAALVQAPELFQLRIKVDGNGDLISGVTGDDLVIAGVVDFGNDGIIEYDGVLLTGEILEFGYQNNNTLPGQTDQFDFRFQVTGGLLAGEFVGDDIGVWMLSPVKSGEAEFVDFSQGFIQRANGVAGAIASLTPPGADPSSISGFIYEDFNNDALIDFNELAIENVRVDLFDGDGNFLDWTTTDGDGLYVFNGLTPGNYTVQEVQPIEYDDGLDTLGEIDGTPVGDATINDVFSDIAIPVTGGVDAINYNFGERPVAGSTVGAGQTATIGFWQNKNGQNLLASVDGSIGDWLAVTFPNMYGINGGVNDLTGMSNAGVAEHYKTLFKSKLKKTQAVEGPAKFDCQVMAAAFAVYVTNENLAGSVAESYGFLVDDSGVGIATWNVGLYGIAFGVDDYTDMTVMDLLLATNERSDGGVLYSDFDVMYRELANKVYTAINEGGDI